MLTSLEFATRLRLIEDAGARLVRRAEATGLEASVPTCPGWSVADLVAHQGMVHRWAAANLAGGDAPFDDEPAVLASVGTDRLTDWFREGVDELLTTLSEVAADVDAMVLLNDAGPPRDFWARRQSHETTIHAVDALAAELGRTPGADETGIDRETALDGIDELVCGFLPRERSRIRSDEPYLLSVEPVDSDLRWALWVGPGRPVAERGEPDRVDATFSGTAAQLYLGLWNRGDELSVSGRPGVLDAWRGQQQVRWR